MKFSVREGGAFVCDWGTNAEYQVFSVQIQVSPVAHVKFLNPLLMVVVPELGPDTHYVRSDARQSSRKESYCS